MSAVHDWATLVADLPEVELHVGDRIEVVGWIWRGYYLAAVYRDDAGIVDTINAAYLRLEPHVEAVAA